MLRPDKFIDIWLVDGPVSVVYLKVRLIINNFWKPTSTFTMGWRRHGSERNEDGSKARRSTIVDGYEIEMNCPQFAATSFKYLDLSNPLRRFCIRVALSP